MRVTRCLHRSMDDWIAASKHVKEVQSDILNVERQRSLEVTLPKWAAFEDLKDGMPAPRGTHLILFHPCYREEDAGPDGGELYSDLQPPAEGYERMWAAGSFEWQADNPILIGQRLSQETTIESVERKTGKTGIENIFIWQRRAISNDRGLSMVDRVCRVFRPAGASAQGSARPASPKLFKSDFEGVFDPTVMTLFRYGALAFNSQRLHIDPDYCKEVEKRRGIVVHGPLLSLLMSRLLEKQSMQASRIDYRALSTLYVGDRALVSGNAAGEVQVTGPAGELAMSARAVLV